MRQKILHNTLFVLTSIFFMLFGALICFSIHQYIESKSFINDTLYKINISSRINGSHYRYVDFYSEEFPYIGKDNSKIVFIDYFSGREIVIPEIYYIEIVDKEYVEQQFYRNERNQEKSNNG